MSDLKLFDFLDAINSSKKNLFDDHDNARAIYSPYIINNGLSQHMDTIMYANEMNQHFSIPKEWQFSFYLNGVPKKKRYGKWAKKDADSDSINTIMEYYKYSRMEAEQALSVLTEDQLNMIKEKIKKGGRNDR